MVSNFCYYDGIQCVSSQFLINVMEIIGRYYVPSNPVI